MERYSQESVLESWLDEANDVREELVQQQAQEVEPFARAVALAVRHLIWRIRLGLTEADSRVGNRYRLCNLDREVRQEVWARIGMHPVLFIRAIQIAWAMDESSSDCVFAVHKDREIAVKVASWLEADVVYYRLRYYVCGSAAATALEKGEFDKIRNLYRWGGSQGEIPS